MTKLNLMPAELVAKIAEDYWMGGDEDMWFTETAPGGDIESGVRHAWIEAAQALEEEASNYDADRGAAATVHDIYHYEFAKIAAHVCRAAARALRQAAREDVEP